jgi:translation initiation factor IF-1
MSMNVIVILTALIMAFVGAAPAGAQDKDSKDSKDRGGIGGVLDTLGGLLGSGASNKLHGAVVTAHDTSVVLRTDDKRSVRVDTASIDPQVRQQLVPGQKVTVTARGGGDVLTASDIQVEQGQASPQAFSRVTGTVQERTNGRILFKTKEGLTLPVDTSQIRGLPYLAANTPATLIYEQGSKQEINAVWIEAGDRAVSASPTAEPASPPAGSQPAASLPSGAPGAGEKLEGLVESVGMSELTVQTTDGRHVRVDTAGVDRTTLASVRPGDIVTVTGNATTDPDKFSANAITKSK